MCVCVCVHLLLVGHRHRRHCHREKHFATTAQSTQHHSPFAVRYIRHLRKQHRQQKRPRQHHHRHQHMTVISKVVHAGIEYCIYMYVCATRATADDNQAKSERLPGRRTCTSMCALEVESVREGTGGSSRWANKLGGHRSVRSLRPSNAHRHTHAHVCFAVAKAISRFAVFPPFDGLGD